MCVKKCFTSWKFFSLQKMPNVLLMAKDVDLSPIFTEQKCENSINGERQESVSEQHEN